jgi:hypothetical protein
MYLAVVKARPLPEAGNDLFETVDKFVRLHQMANVKAQGQDKSIAFGLSHWSAMLGDGLW